MLSGEQVGQGQGGAPPSWLLLLFQLPVDQASQRVTVWRKLQRYGALQWKGSAWLLPASATNLERFQWLLQEIRKAGGDGSVASVVRFEELPDEGVREQFNQARAKDYEQLAEEVERLLESSAAQGRRPSAAAAARFRRRMEEIERLDVFRSLRRQLAEEAVHRIEAGAGLVKGGKDMKSEAKHAYRGRTWMTRPQPEIDRVASAWFIRRFIDEDARFVFGADLEKAPDAIGFDMFPRRGTASMKGTARRLFTHVGDACTLEVLLQEFGPDNRRLRILAEMVHDADLEDGKFGRPEGGPLQAILQGWGSMGLSDEEILRRGFEMLDALYASLAE